MQLLEVGKTVTVNLGDELVELSVSHDAVGLLMLDLRTTTRPIVLEIERREGREYKALWPCLAGRWRAAGMAHRLWVGGGVVLEIGGERLRLAVVPDEPAGVRVRIESERLPAPTLPPPDPVVLQEQQPRMA